MRFINGLKVSWLVVNKVGASAPLFFIFITILFTSILDFMSGVARHKKHKIELKSLILAQIERWRHALHMQVER